MNSYMLSNITAVEKTHQYPKMSDAERNWGMWLVRSIKRIIFAT